MLEPPLTERLEGISVREAPPCVEDPGEGVGVPNLVVIARVGNLHVDVAAQVDAARPGGTPAQLPEHSGAGVRREVEGTEPGVGPPGGPIRHLRLDTAPGHEDALLDHADRVRGESRDASLRAPMGPDPRGGMHHSGARESS